MNAMNFVFVPRGLSVDVLETYFDHLYRTFYSRSDVLLSLARMLIAEPKYVRRLATAGAVYVRSKFAEGRYLIGRLPQRYRAALSS
jgi:hypothetical protein